MDLKKYFNLIEKKWEQEEYEVKGDVWKVPSMLTKSEKKLLSYLTEEVFSGAGKILDLGCFLGGSTTFLAHGLMKNKKHTSIIEVFDLFKLANFEKKHFFPKHNLKVPKDLDSEKLFRAYTKPFTSILNVNKGNILDYKYSGEKIEILFVDLMKSSQIYDHVILEFFEHLIPMKSIIILQDYYFAKSGLWHYLLTFLLKDKLKYLSDTNINSAVFLCTERIKKADLRRCLWGNAEPNQKARSLFHAYEECRTHKQREIIKDSLGFKFKKMNEEKGGDYNKIARLST